jgi:hypothetical protein
LVSRARLVVEEADKYSPDPINRRLTEAGLESWSGGVSTGIRPVAKPCSQYPQGRAGGCGENRPLFDSQWGSEAANIESGETLPG